MNKSYPSLQFIEQVINERKDRLWKKRYYDEDVPNNFGFDINREMPTYVKFIEKYNKETE